MKIIESLRKSEEPLIIGGDGGHDSMGHCAKYGAYSVMCYNNPAIIHFELIQVCSSLYYTILQYIRFLSF